MVKKVAKVTHAIASEGTSKNWHFDFSDVAISIENSQNFTGWARWAGNLYGILLDPSIPPNNPIDYQPEDGATKLSNENSAI